MRKGKEPLSLKENANDETHVDCIFIGQPGFVSLWVFVQADADAAGDLHARAHSDAGVAHCVRRGRPDQEFGV